MKQAPKMIYIVSGGAGSVGTQMIDTILVQFPESHCTIKKKVFVVNESDIDEVIQESLTHRALIAYTLLDVKLKKYLELKGKSNDLIILDLIGSAMDFFSAWLNQEPKARPGLYHQLNKAYFSRIEAIEFSMGHDDNRKLATINEAEIVLLGVSRVGKTPLSMYLAVNGWKVANIALVKGVPLPEELNQVDRRRIIGLYIGIEQLMEHRKKRIREAGLHSSPYSVSQNVFEESEFFRDLFQKRKYATIDVTNKPIESSFKEAVDIIASRLGECAHF